MSEDPCECRICPWRGPRAELIAHLQNDHGLDQATREKLQARLHASKDTPEESENTLGFYEGEMLVFIMVQRRVREADDPMRF